MQQYKQLNHDAHNIQNQPWEGQVERNKFNQKTSFQ